MVIGFHFYFMYILYERLPIVKIHLQRTLDGIDFVKYKMQQKNQTYGFLKIIRSVASGPLCNNAPKDSLICSFDELKSSACG